VRVGICPLDAVFSTSRSAHSARIVDGWVEEIGLDSSAYGTHSMRRTKPTLSYRRTKNLRAVQLLLGHTKLASTVRALGIEVDDASEMAEETAAYTACRPCLSLDPRGEDREWRANHGLRADRA
jgi:integrase